MVLAETPSKEEATKKVDEKKTQAKASEASPSKKGATKKVGEKKSPPKDTPAKKASPVSAFKQGGVKSFVKKKDDNHLLFVSGVFGGIVSVCVQKYNVEAGAYMTPFFARLQKDEAYRSELQINALMPRRSSDGTAMMSGGYPWEQMICLVGPYVAENPVERKRLAEKILRAINQKDVQAEFTWPRNVKFGGDLTTSPIGAVDTILTDKDCMEIMQISYPDSSSPLLSGYDDVLSDYFTCVSEERTAWVRDFDSDNI